VSTLLESQWITAEDAGTIGRKFATDGGEKAVTIENTLPKDDYRGLKLRTDWAISLDISANSGATLMKFMRPAYRQRNMLDIL
jgi:hypothetical protein